MNLELEIDRYGTPWWLQARPITALPGVLGEMDSTLAGEDYIYTCCSIGEIMPSAVYPLTASVSGYAIDYAMHIIQVEARAQPSYDQPWLQVGYLPQHTLFETVQVVDLQAVR